MQPAHEPNKLYRLFSDKNLTRLSVGIIVIGAVLRLVLYFQNRCLIIDEANVARNLYERSYGALTTPLSYEQYAPPVFLWIVKSFTLLFGFSEQALRLFSLLCGLASLWLLYKALRTYAGLNAMWYALMIFAGGLIYIRYATELKQYMCDVVVVLSLLLLALRISILNTSRSRFFLLWFVIGSVAIWLSMPAVFMLTGVACYYLYQCLKARKYDHISILAAAGITWLAQFAAYYFIILKPQINSDYLQTFHQYSFLFKFPDSKYKWDSNMAVLNTVFSSMGGKWAISIGFHLVALVTGIVWLIRKQTAKAVLLLAPVLALYVAATLHQYALTPRIILFIMPLLLIIIASGLHALLQVRYLAVKAIWIAAAAICIFNFGAFDLLYKRMELEEITKSMAFVQQHQITGDHLYINHSGTPAYIYYTTIHPGKATWQSLDNAHQLHWDSNFDSLGKTFTAASAVLYGWWPAEQVNAQRAALQHSHKEVQQFTMPETSAYIYE